MDYWKLDRDNFICSEEMREIRSNSEKGANVPKSKNIVM